MAQFAALFLIAATISPAIATCGYGTAIQPRQEQEVIVGKFGYIGPEGPIGWVFLDPEANILCGTGVQQSPIDLVGETLDVVSGSSINLTILDMPSGAMFENLGTTIEVIAEGGSMTPPGGTDQYTLKQFHFHLPSEHLANSTSMAMEMHMVWEGPESKVAVIGVFIDIDETSGLTNQTGGQSTQDPDSTLLETVFGSVEDIREPGTAIMTPPLIMSDVVSMLQATQFQTYSGSLTTPPCTEGVTWLVSNEKLIVAPRTYETVRSVIGFNSRFPQNGLGEPNLLRLAAMRSIDS